MPGYRPLARRVEKINRNHAFIVNLFKSNLENEVKESKWLSILTHHQVVIVVFVFQDCAEYFVTLKV